jgi:hypothetical protein
MHDQPPNDPAHHRIDPGTATGFWYAMARILPHCIVYSLPFLSSYLDRTKPIDEATSRAYGRGMSEAMDIKRSQDSDIRYHMSPRKDAREAMRARGPALVKQAQEAVSRVHGRDITSEPDAALLARYRRMSRGV